MRFSLDKNSQSALGCTAHQRGKSTQDSDPAFKSPSGFVAEWAQKPRWRCLCNFSSVKYLLTRHTREHSWCLEPACRWPASSHAIAPGEHVWPCCHHRRRRQQITRAPQRPWWVWNVGQAPAEWLPVSAMLAVPAGPVCYSISILQTFHSPVAQYCTNSGSTFAHLFSSAPLPFRLICHLRLIFHIFPLPKRRQLFKRWVLTKENVLELSKNEGLICCCFLCAFATNDNRTWPNCLKSIKKQTWSPNSYYPQQSQDSYSEPLVSSLVFVMPFMLSVIKALSVHEHPCNFSHPKSGGCHGYFEKSPLEQLDAKSTSTFRDQWELNVHCRLLLSRICCFLHPGPLQWRLAWLKCWCFEVFFKFFSL